MAVLERDAASAMRRHELAGPDTLDHIAVADLALRAAGRERPLVRVPERVTRAALQTLEALMKSKAPATWDEAELLQVSMTSRHGTADAEALGVTPRLDGRGPRSARLGHRRAPVGPRVGLLELGARAPAACPRRSAGR